MPDSIEERLDQLGGSLEAAVVVGSPTMIRARADRNRTARRRRFVALTAVTATVAVVGIGTAVALRPNGGHKGSVVSPGATTGVTASTTSSAQSAQSWGRVDVLIDLEHDKMTVYDKQGAVLRTVAVTGGAADHPSPTGTFTVSAKLKEEKLSSAEVGYSTGDFYTTTVDWVIQLDAGGPQVYAMPWNSGAFGKANMTHGEIGMDDTSARWLYDHLAVGDRIRIQ